MTTDRSDNIQNRLLRALDVPRRPEKAQHLSAYSQEQLQQLSEGALPGADKLDAHQLADLPFDKLLDEARALSMDEIKQVVGEAAESSEVHGASASKIDSEQNKTQDTLSQLDNLTQYANESVRELLKEVHEIKDLSRRHDAEQNMES